jgi:hypothetical protein
VPGKRKHVEPLYQAPKATVDKLLANGKEFNRVSTDFLKIDAATGLTFAGIALQTDDATKKQRNRLAARKAYDTIRRLAKGVDLTPNDAQVLSRDLGRLKSELQTLGETF